MKNPLFTFNHLGANYEVCMDMSDPSEYKRVLVFDTADEIELVISGVVVEYLTPALVAEMLDIQARGFRRGKDSGKELLRDDLRRLLDVPSTGYVGDLHDRIEKDREYQEHLREAQL